MTFALGCILALGRFTAAELTAEALSAPAVRAEMAKVTMHPAELFDDDAAAREGPEATRVTVMLRDGRTLSHLQVASTGKPVNPVSDARLDSKFITNVTPVLGPDGAAALLARLRSLADRDDVRGLLAPGDSLRGVA